MEAITEKTYDLRAFGIRACGKVWLRMTDAWCEICAFPDSDGAIDLYYLASGFGIVTDGRTRRIVYGGTVWCGTSAGKGTETVMLGGNARLYGMRLKPPTRDTGWCGFDLDAAACAWKLLSAQTAARPLAVAPELEDDWRGLFAKLELPDAERVPAMVCMAFGILVSRCLDGMSRSPLRAVKSAECILTHLETCKLRNFPTIEKLANRLGYSSGHLMTCFRSVFGVTLKQCMDMIRCEYAARRIRAGETVQAVAAACGYGSWVAFRKTFAKQFGMTVNDYRARCGVKAKGGCGKSGKGK